MEEDLYGQTAGGRTMIELLLIYLSKVLMVSACLVLVTSFITNAILIDTGEDQGGTLQRDNRITLLIFAIIFVAMSSF